MSADNGVYIAEFPTSIGGEWKEWRVAHLQNIEDCWDPQIGEAVTVLMFGRLKIYTDRNEAVKEAHRIAEEVLADSMCPVLEYGIRPLPFYKPFPTMTEEEANRQVNEFFRLSSG